MKNHKNMYNTLVLGGGVAGNLLVEKLSLINSQLNIIGFVDDNNIKAIGTIQDIPKLIEKHHIQKIVIAIPSERGKLIRKILLILSEYSEIELLILPRTTEIVVGEHVSAEDLRNLELHDLVGEHIDKSLQKEISSKIQGENILITGGGGSIGSELSKQILLASPKKLIIVDFCEYNLFKLEQSLKRISELTKNTEIKYVLGNVNNIPLIETLLKSNKIHTICHASAYKHVPLVESNVYEGVLNNAFSTFNLAMLAKQCDVKNFILISTDKAVRPYNIMGKTKKLAELAVELVFKNSVNHNFAIVRFGNVFNSSGSAVELFLSQLNTGNTITITDPQMTRFFMTIPEAVQLVLQAGIVASKNSIYMLKMGDPVNIMELAKCIAVLKHNKLSDIKFEITGKRSGEKIHEELFDNSTETIEESIHPRIFKINHQSHTSPDNILNELTNLFDNLDSYEIQNHSSTGQQILINQIDKIISLCH
ncbi:MAG: polysaccharide biosynthesis protein [Candidatus Roizmanbacteria bacterium]